MGYQRIDPSSVEPTPDRPCLQRAIGDAADLERMAVNVYEADPGEQIPLAYHYHDQQEELFYVIDGRLHVETPEQEYRIDAGELFVVEPESPQRAHNPGDADSPVRVLAVGAPPVDDAHAHEPER
ncbi:MAG: cupin domain-containing protein [Haloarculaceae archaeon]